MNETTTPPREVRKGWGVMRPGDRVFHYYVDSESLCRRIALYFGPLEPHQGGEEPGPKDCKACWKKLSKLESSVES